MASDIKTSQLCCLRMRLYSTLLPQAAGQPSEPRLAPPRHGSLTPGRISVGRPPCLVPIPVGAGTGRKYHCPWRSRCDTACHRLFCGRTDSLGTLFGRRW